MTAVEGRAVGSVALPGGSGGGGSTPIVEPGAAALNLVAATGNPWDFSNPANASAGFLLLMRCRMPGGKPISRLGCWLTNAGGAANGRTGMAYYTAAGVLIDTTADMSAAFAGAEGWISGALAGGSQTPAAASFYLGVLTNLTTNPKIQASPASALAIPVINGAPPSIFFTGLADFPANFDPATGTLNSGGYYMTASA